ncbi:AI-2E family transporter [Halalkalicoccus subterraneus]|uniref:AI-2E family transporter n=1 Tax=Halalkalicoccus subterraneus TaxID=2675002 RepID=UPI000EFC2846|nr:AI-2E family transporter [Halalkalicoccus subterraneus]
MNKQRGFLLFSLALSGLVGLYVVLPFIEYVLASVLLAYALYPLHARLAPHIGPRLSPIALIALTGGVVVLPFVLVSLALVRDLRALAAGESGLRIGEVEASIATYTGREVDIEGLAMLGAEMAFESSFDGITELFGAALQALFGLALVLFLLYYLLKDGACFVSWLKEATPLPPDVTDRLYCRIDATTWAVIVGHIFVAFVQGLAGGIGLLIAGVPSPVFWTAVMVLLALLPLIGAFLVWAPAGVYLLLIGQPYAGLFLLVYGVVVVSMIDNYLRPIVIDSGAQLNPGVILVGVFGGIYSLGFVGLFVGPIALGILGATLSTVTNDYHRL